jgi:hypothetical protein
MLLLRDFGLFPSTPQARRACAVLLDQGFQCDGGINYGVWAKWTRRSETCVTGMILSVLLYFEYEDPRLYTIARHLLEQQMPDGGWNCRRSAGATHSSVHTTISVLESLRLYELHRARHLREVRLAQRRGREFLLVPASFAPIVPAQSSSPNSPASLFRPDGTTTSFALSITFRPSTRPATRA